MIGFTPRYKIGTFCGIDVYADPRLPVGKWHFDKPEAREFANKLADLEHFLQCSMMRVKCIDIVDARDTQS